MLEISLMPALGLALFGWGLARFYPQARRLDQALALVLQKVFLPVIFLSLPLYADPLRAGAGLSLAFYGLLGLAGLALVFIFRFPQRKERVYLLGLALPAWFLVGWPLVEQLAPGLDPVDFLGWNLAPLAFFYLWPRAWTGRSGLGSLVLAGLLGLALYAPWPPALLNFLEAYLVVDQAFFLLAYLYLGLALGRLGIGDFLDLSLLIFTLIKTLILPVLAYGGLVLTGLEPEVAKALFFLAACPVSPLLLVFDQRDRDLKAACVLMTSLASFLLLPFLQAWFF